MYGSSVVPEPRIEGNTGKCRIMNTISIIFSLLASILVASMVVFVLFKDWQDQINRYFATFSILALGILFSMFLTYAFKDELDLGQLNRITQMFTIVFFASLLAMSLVFPKREKKFPFKISFLIMIPAIVIGVTVASTELTITDAYFKEGILVRDFVTINGITPYDYYAGIAFIYLLLGTGNFIRKYFKIKIEVYRLQMRYVFVGTSIGVILASVCSIILPRVFGYSDLYVIGPSLAAFFTVFALFYSVIAYHIMDITTAIHKTAMYAIISMVIILPIYGIMELYKRKMFFFDQVPAAYIAVFIVAVFILFSIYIQPIIDRLFKRRHYQFEDVVDTFIRNVGKIQDVEEIVKRSIDILFSNLNLERAFFVFLNDQTRTYNLLYSRSDSDFSLEPVERNSSVIRWFVRNQEILLLGRVYTDDRSFTDIREDVASFFTENGIRIILPIYHDRRLVGLLCLGEKSNLSGYSPDEVEKLRYFQGKSNEFIGAAISYNRAMKQQFVERTVDLSTTILTKTIPVSLPKIRNLRFGTYIYTKYESGSDYFDFIRPGDQGIGIVTTDISGVGVGSALYSVLLRSGFHASINDAPSTSTVIHNLNRALHDYSRGSGSLVTAYYLYCDLNSMRMMYTNAGNPAMELFRVEKNDFDQLDTEGIPLGYTTETTYGIGRTDLFRGDIGILYSKSLINSKNRSDEEFGLLKLRNIVFDNRNRQPAEIASLINRAFESHVGLRTPESDVLALVFKVV